MKLAIYIYISNYMKYKQGNIKKYIGYKHGY